MIEQQQHSPLQSFFPSSPAHPSPWLFARIIPFLFLLQCTHPYHFNLFSSIHLNTVISATPNVSSVIFNARICAPYVVPGLTTVLHAWGGEGRGGEGVRGREGGEGGKGQLICCVTSLIGMFNSNPMIPQYLNNNLT